MNKQLIVVYGTLRQQGHNHKYYLNNAKYLGEFKTEPIYNLYNLFGFPGLKEDGNTSVLCEVYEVNAYEAKEIDNLEGYKEGIKPTFYDKKKIDIPFGEASIYIYMGKVYEENKIESGNWIEFINNK